MKNENYMMSVLIVALTIIVSTGYGFDIQRVIVTPENLAEHPLTVEILVVADRHIEDLELATIGVSLPNERMTSELQDYFTFRATKDNQIFAAGGLRLSRVHFHNENEVLFFQITRDLLGESSIHFYNPRDENSGVVLVFNLSDWIDIEEMTPKIRK